MPGYVYQREYWLSRYHGPNSKEHGISFMNKDEAIVAWYKLSPKARREYAITQIDYTEVTPV